ncbi:MAG TPA: hypothetical protein PK771_05310, partial [Spirochaetota bacterium]|nr:hypothetical protein [Spirochaetota bacterium]
RFNTIILRNRDKIEDFQSFKVILKINDIDCILNYNLENSNDNEHNLIKNRNNSDYIYDNKKYIDYFSQSGRDTLANKISDIFNEGHIGLNIENIILKSDSIDDSDKIVVKSENNIIQYNKNIKVAIKKINSIFKETVNKDKIIYSDLYNSDLVDFIYFHDMKGDIKSFYHFIGDFFHQGYNKIAFYISQRPKNYHILLSILFSSGFYIDFNLLKKIINNKNFISKLQNIIDYRDSLQIYLKNINGLLFEIFYFKNILSGFFIGKSLYIGFIKKYLFQNYFSLPDCRLYCIEENKVVSGQVLYYFNKKQNDFLSFQAENSMIPFKKNNKIIFSIFVNMTSTFAVNDLSTNYNFDIIIDNKTIVIDFVSTMITNYEIELDFVIKDYKIKTILLGDKKILINKKNDIAVISFINDKKKTNIKIVFELN